MPTLHASPAEQEPRPLTEVGSEGASTGSLQGVSPPDELLVIFRPGTSEARRQAIHQAVGTQILSQMLGGRISHVKLPGGKTLAEVQSAYAEFLEVEAAEPNHPIEVQGHERKIR